MTSVPVHRVSRASNSSNYGSTPSTSSSGAMRALSLELKSLQNEPVEGFRVEAKEDNLFEWNVAIFGPPGTLYQGGYFKAQLKFPTNYPYSPPLMRFRSPVWHPNVYEDGNLCVSILHPPVDDPHSGELACERWNPTQNVRTILLSVISLLNEPNTSSPANVDASVMYRKWRDDPKHDQYANIVRSQVENSRKDADADGVVVPTTVEEYCVKPVVSRAQANAHYNDFDLDDDFYDYGDDDSEEEDENVGDEEDSGQGES